MRTDIKSKTSEYEEPMEHTDSLPSFRDNSGQVRTLLVSPYFAPETQLISEAYPIAGYGNEPISGET